MYKSLFSKYIINMGVRDIAIIDPSETYFVKKVTIPQTTAVIIPTGNERASIVPTPVATDFPPVNPKNTDLLCPIKTDKEYVRIQIQ